MSSVRSVVRGTGSYLPARVLTNAAMESMVATSDAWIRQRTGIGARHIAAEGEYTSDLATAAAKAALESAGIDASEIDLIVLATATPDLTFPATAVTVQERLGIEQGFAFDLQAVCSGFVYALTNADALLKAGQAKKALVIGAETFSRILDWSDRTTCVLFGDGAGAVVLEAVEESEAGGRGLLSCDLRADGRFRDKLYVDGGPSTTQTAGHLRMEGREVFKQAVGLVHGVVERTLQKAGVTADDLDWFVPHQANRRIIDATARKFDWPEEKIVVTVEGHGNTSAASIPLALDVAVRDGRIKQGDLVLVEALGGGFTWGAALVRW
ncbi:MAG: ketoacyl-ACP synthase III [Rhodobiaceae bacterium]|nr:ketoacyl-ACP synthase III [Rhodobiaceae bacterium]MCC0052017.1 ketoacyl-ACP synthase III [Rhodobiaceae bacterium]MCC0061640.1 ketoacyl-ACP synthase III [Rhodobiaceae bacterium]